MDCCNPQAALLFLPVIVILILFALFVCLTISVVKVIAYCRIFSRAGYSWALGLLMLLPLVHTIMLFVLGFSKWPIQKEMDLLKKR